MDRNNRNKKKTYKQRSLSMDRNDYKNKTYMQKDKQRSPGMERNNKTNTQPKQTKLERLQLNCAAGNSHPAAKITW